MEKPYASIGINHCSNRRKLGNYIRILGKDFSRNRYIYLMISVGLLYYLIFHYGSMFGIIMAFQDYSPGKGFFGSKWVGLDNFKYFIKSIYFWRVFKNTILINLYQLLWGFPVPIILALLLNEIRNNYFKKLVQTVTYLPHFISIMVISGMLIDFTAKSGLINNVISFLGGDRANLLMEPQLFRTIYVATGIWQGAGWGSIIYIAALTNINQELYESAMMDGAGRWKQTLHITLPGIMPTVVIMLILQVGQMMNVNFEKIILIYNPVTFETADVISSFVYRKGILEADFSYTAAVGLFNSIINCLLLIFANTVSRKVNETSLW